MKKLLVCILVLALIGCAALCESEWTQYPLGDFNMSLPVDWTTTYNSQISILSSHELPNGNFDHILTAMLMSLGDPIEDDEQLAALYNLISDEFEIEATIEDEITINDDQAVVWSGTHKGNDAAGIIYCHGDTAVIIIHMIYGLSPEERLDYEKNIAAQITVGEN